MVPGAQKKLHLLHAVLRGRVFDGQFESQGKGIAFNFLPQKATVVDERLVVSGRVVFTQPKQTAVSLEVTATLIATQGGVGVSPIRRQLLTGTAQTAQTATSDQRLEQEKGPETDIQPGLHSFEPPKYDEVGRPRVESTDTLSFVGVLYFKLSPIDNKELGLSLDMSDIQLGARLAPTDDLARDLQLLFSDAVMALDKKDDRLLKSSIDSLNSAFGF
jgi:hypothetical protein